MPVPRSVRLLPALAVWAATVPYLADAVGLRLEVDAALEVADHVIPGLLVLAVAAYLILGRPPVGGAGWLAGAAAAVLAGLWITTTHVPLVPEMLDGTSPALAGLLHLSAGPPILVAALLILLARP